VLFLSVEEKVKELAKEIKETDEYQEMMSAQTRIKLDPRAQEIVEKIQEGRQKVEQARSEGKQITPDIMKNLQDLQTQAENNATLKKYLEAQVNFNKVMENVNRVLIEEMSL
jgi:cell fate (sporulation/competence/biofilm development) regulator YlbF (YheA/YmcA/DUF963 family)